MRKKSRMQNPVVQKADSSNGAAASAATAGAQGVRFSARRARGLSVVELMVSLAITAMLLTATAVATDASFRAYAAAAESASTQTTTRLATHRLMAMIRTSTAHGPLLPSTDASFPVTLDQGSRLSSRYIELIDASGGEVRVEWRESKQELWVITRPAGATLAEAQPLLGGVTSATFHAWRRRDRDGVWVLERASLDVTVRSDADSSLAIESGDAPPIRVVASTMPRKLD